MAETLVMLAQEYKASRIKQWPVLVEPKLDGIRIFFKNGKGYTRNGKTYETLDGIAKELLDIYGKDILIDTEVVASNWNETAKLIKRIHDIDYEGIKQNIWVYIFDYVNPIAENIQQAERKYTAKLVFVDYLIKHNHKTNYHIEIIEDLIASNEDDIDKYYKFYLSKGYEGIMIKDPSSLYEYKRSFAWMKYKPRKDITATIVDYECGEGLCPDCSMKKSTGDKTLCGTCKGTGEISKPNILGTLICDYEGKVLRVGSGFTMEDRKKLWKKRKKLIGKKIDILVQDDPKNNDILARFPVFQRFRDDV